MEIEYAIIADYAEANGGKLYLMGGGWDVYGLGEVPGQVRMAVAIGVRFEWDEANRTLPVTMVVEDDDGGEIVRLGGGMTVGRPAHLAPGTRQLAQMAANMLFQVPAFGGYRVVVRAGEGEGAHDRTLPFRVVQNR